MDDTLIYIPNNDRQNTPSVVVKRLDSQPNEPTDYNLSLQRF